MGFDKSIGHIEEFQHSGISLVHHHSTLPSSPHTAYYIFRDSFGVLEARTVKKSQDHPLCLVADSLWMSVTLLPAGHRNVVLLAVLGHSI